MRSRKTIYNIVTSLLLQIIIIIYGFIVPKIIINTYGSGVNGLISSITQFLAYISLLDSGFTAVIKSQLYKPIAENNNKELSLILKSANSFFKKIAYILIIYVVVLSFTYPFLVKNSFDYWFTFGLIIIISISIFAEYYFGMVYKVFLQAEQKSYIISLIQIIIYCIIILLTIILTKINVSIYILKLIISLVFVLRPFIQLIYVKKHYDINLKIEGKYKIKNKWDGLSQHIASVIHGNTDITVLTIFLNLTEVSVYSVYYLVVKGIKSLIQSFTGGIDAMFGDMIAKKEKHNLLRKFTLYELLYNMVSVITFSSTIVLILPFISIYTKNITDANYIRYTFGVLLVISEYIWAIRLPYSSVTLAAGHFKETKIGAWMECIFNIIISVVMVRKYGIIGVTIGTIVAMTVRTIEFIYHANKYILNRSMIHSIKNILLIIAETLLIIFICKYLPYFANINYMYWIFNSIMVVFVASLVVLLFNIVFSYNELKEALIIGKNIFRRSHVKKNNSFN